MKVLSILQRKFVFKKNPKVDLLILDDNFSKLNFSKNKYHVLRHDEELHLKILLKAVLKKFTTNKIQSFSDLYFKLLIDSFDPKVALGHDMNNKIFRSDLFKHIDGIALIPSLACILKKNNKILNLITSSKPFIITQHDLELLSITQSPNTDM